MPGPSNAPIGSVANLFVLQVPVAAGSALVANTSEERTYTVPGLQLGDVVNVCKPTFQAAIAIANVRVSAANTLAITFGNFGAGTPTLTAENYLLSVVRHSFPTAAAIPTGIG
jgi:hypothetical protein